MLTVRLTSRARSLFSRDPEILGHIQFGVSHNQDKE